MCFSRNNPAYYRWTVTRNYRATYVEATLQMIGMISEKLYVHKELDTSQIRQSDDNVFNVLNAFGNFNDPFKNHGSDSHLYCVSPGRPASSVIANDLLNAQQMGHTAMASSSDAPRTARSSKNNITLVKSESRTKHIWRIINASQQDINQELTLPSH